MAYTPTFSRRDADVTALYQKVSTGPAENQYKLVRLPYNLVTLDDGTTGIEPVNHEITYEVTNQEKADLRVNRVDFVEWPPFAGLNEIKDFIS